MEIEPGAQFVERAGAQLLQRREIENFRRRVVRFGGYGGGCVVFRGGKGVVVHGIFSSRDATGFWPAPGEREAARYSRSGDRPGRFFAGAAFGIQSWRERRWVGDGRERSGVAVGSHGNRPRPRRGRIILHHRFHKGAGYRPGKVCRIVGFLPLQWTTAGGCADGGFARARASFPSRRKLSARSAARFKTPSAEKIPSPNSSRSSSRTSGS